jgi:hypothetical protein
MSNLGQNSAYIYGRTDSHYIKIIAAVFRVCQGYIPQIIEKSALVRSLCEKTVTGQITGELIQKRKRSPLSTSSINSRWNRNFYRKILASVLLPLPEKINVLMALIR